MKRTIVLIIAFSALILAQDFDYIGVSKCKMCHKKEEKGAQFKQWEASPHAGAFETLKSEKSAQIAKKKGIEGEAWKAPECLKCHTTGFGAGGYEVKDEVFWNPADDDKAGGKAVKRMKNLESVGCEACHGAGSKYKSKKTMVAITAGEIEGSTVGLNTISEETCTGCHNEESPTNNPFNYEEMSEKVVHPMPAN